MKTGLVLLNVGTPDQPDTSSVRNYLREFLMDPDVIDIPYPLRWMLVNWGILPKRPQTSAQAYQKIWTERGSPLLFHLLDLVDGVQENLGNDWMVVPAMRYGRPSITSAFAKLRDAKVEKLIVFPLYPQYSLAATHSGILECNRVARTYWGTQDIQFIEPFYSHPLFIQSFLKVIQDNLRNYSYDYVLFSFHGLPERQVKKTELSPGYCLKSEGCCDRISEANKNCYRAQCYSTAALLAGAMGLNKDQYSICFQSRLGRTPWIRPFTDELYRELPQKGKKRLAVICPSFVADCLETLEEVQIRGREDFMKNGGEDLKLVPSLNSSLTWIQAVANMVRES